MNTVNPSGSARTERPYSRGHPFAGRSTRRSAFDLAMVFRRRRFLAGFVTIVLTLWGMVWGVMLLANRPAAPLTSPYADLFLSKDSQASVRQILDCGSGDFYAGPIDGRGCGTRPPAEPFSSVGLRVRDDVTEIQLQVRENAITLRDLSLVWGAPDIQQSDTLLALAWPEMRVQAFAQAHEQPFSLFLPVQRITISIPHTPF